MAKRTLVRSWVDLLFFAVIASGGAHAQRPPAVWEVLQGSWVGRGQLFGQEAEFSMDWDRTLEGAFTRLRFYNALASAGGLDTVLTAEGYYRHQDGDSVTGIWLDTRGMILPLRGVASDVRLTVWWGSQNTEQGKTVYEVVDPASMTVTDSVISGGAWREFGRAQYRRR